MEIKFYKAINLLTISLALIVLPAVWVQALDLGSKPGDYRKDAKVQLQAKKSSAPSSIKITYLDFWASWCGPCKQSFPWMAELDNKYSAKGLNIVAISLDSNEKDARAFMAEHPVPFEVLHDSSGKSAELYQVATMPSSFLLDESGAIIASYSGCTETTEKDADSAIKKALGL